jgi:hypothetical protein
MIRNGVTDGLIGMTDSKSLNESAKESPNQPCFSKKHFLTLRRPANLPLQLGDRGPSNPHKPARLEN